MIRSYAVGCTLFVLNRVTDPIAFFHNLRRVNVLRHNADVFHQCSVCSVPSLMEGWDAIVTRPQVINQ